MTGRPLPVPDGDGIYGFPDDLLATLSEWHVHLRSLHESGTQHIIELVAPLSKTTYPIAVRTPAGRPILALEPHHDDLILSAGGHFLSRPRPMTVVTVFTVSNSVHPDVSRRLVSTDELSVLRAEESRQAFRPLAAKHHLVGLKDAEPPYRAFEPAAVAQLADTLQPFLAENPDAELIAPAGVTRHPDHLLVHEAARQLGCRWFWDDTSFYPTYAANVDDRHLFERRTGRTLTSEVADITTVVLDKLTLLHLYQSQMQPLREMYRVLRYNWTVAAEAETGTAATRLTRYGERFFRPAPQAWA